MEFIAEGGVALIMVVIWLIIGANDTFLNETSWDADARWTACAERARPTMPQPKMEQNVGLQIENDLTVTRISKRTPSLAVNLRHVVDCGVRLRRSLASDEWTESAAYLGYLVHAPFH